MDGSILSKLFDPTYEYGQHAYALISIAQQNISTTNTSAMKTFLNQENIPCPPNNEKVAVLYKWTIADKVKSLLALESRRLVLSVIQL